jgi:hypothetical protein
VIVLEMEDSSASADDSSSHPEGSSGYRGAPQAAPAPQARWSSLVSMPADSPSPSAARERVLAAVPGLEALLAGGTPGDQVCSDPLVAGDDPDGWILWFVLRPDCLVIAVPVAGLRQDAVPDAVVRCNAYNGGMRWSVLSVAPWEGDQVATLSARVPVLPEAGGRWETIGGAMEAVVRDAGPARSVFEGLIGDEAG